LEIQEESLSTWRDLRSLPPLSLPCIDPQIQRLLLASTYPFDGNVKPAFLTGWNRIRDTFYEEYVKVPLKTFSKKNAVIIIVLFCFWVRQKPKKPKIK
jgi:hypothetical protein